MTEEKKADFEVTRMPATVARVESFRTLYGGPPPHDGCRLCGNTQKPGTGLGADTSAHICNACGAPLAEPLNAKEET